MPVLRIDELATVDLGDISLDEGARPVTAVVFVDLDAQPGPTDAIVRAVAASPLAIVGLAATPPTEDLAPLLQALTFTMVGSGANLPVTQVRVDDIDAARAVIERAVANSPRAALTVCQLLSLTPHLSVSDGLVAESLAYSMLLAAPEFSHWRASVPVGEIAAAAGPPVLIERVDGVLNVTLNRPQRHNAFDRSLRDGLIEAIDLALLDPSLEHVELRGAGPSFCSGGDLDEFGTSPDPASAHLIRIDRSVAVRVDRCRERVHVHVHGACIGAGIEIPSFAARISADPNSYFQLPELAMGLIPGAGGTVGLPRRIGHWRTAYLALSGTKADVATALEWGLVDDCAAD
jgi:hypothetical protein